MRHRVTEGERVRRDEQRSHDDRQHRDHDRALNRGPAVGAQPGQTGDAAPLPPQVSWPLVAVTQPVLGGHGGDLGRGQLDRRGGDVVVQVGHRSSARDRQDRRRPGQEPGEHDLPRRRVVPLRQLLHGPVAVKVLDRRPRQEHDLLLLAQVDERLRPAIVDVVPVLDRHDRGELLCAPQLVLGDVGQPDVPDLALLLEGDQCADRVLQRYRGVGPVELVERDLLELEPPQASLAGLDQVVRPAVLRPLPGTGALEAALGRDHEIIRVRRQRLADELLADVRTVGVGGVDEVDAELDRAT